MASLITLSEEGKRFQQRLLPYKREVLFAQEVVCWRRPLPSAVFGISGHLVWCYFTLSPAPFLSKLAAFCLGIVIIDAVVRFKRFANIDVHIPQVAEPDGREPLNNSQGFCRLRTFNELCEALASGQRFAYGLVESWRQAEQELRGKFQLLVVLKLLFLAAVFSYIPTPVITYPLLLLVLCGPVVERHGRGRAITAHALNLASHHLSQLGSLGWRAIHALPNFGVVVSPPRSYAEFERELEQEHQQLKTAFRKEFRQPTSTGSASSAQASTEDAQSDAESADASQLDDDFSPRPRGWSVLEEDPCARQNTSTAEQLAEAFAESDEDDLTRTVDDGFQLVNPASIPRD